MRMSKLLTFTLPFALLISLVSPLQSNAFVIPASFQITGAGYGHGVGMSQMGARSKALAGENLSVVNDSFGQPTSALAVARQIVALVSTNPPAGIFHATNSGSATWYEFADAIVGPITNQATVTPVSSTAFPTVAVRPKYSVLDHTRWSACGITDMPHWRDSLKEIHSAVVDSVK